VQLRDYGDEMYRSPRSGPTTEEPKKYQQVGPLNPALVLPPALLSRALQSLREDELWQTGGLEFARAFAIFLALLFDLCREGIDRRFVGDVIILQIGKNNFLLALYGELELEIRFDQELLEGIELRASTKYSRRLIDKVDHSRVREDVVQSCRRRFRVSPTSSPLVGVLLSILWNCPYCPDLVVPFEHKWRSRIIRIVSRKEDTQSTTALQREIEMHPRRVLALKGWCGGKIIHPVSRLGNISQLKMLFSTAADLGTNEAKGFQIEQLRDVRNYDGYTPLMIARLFGQSAATELLISSGAVEYSRDFYGRLCGRN
jgi:hypothetical protein